MKTETRGTRRVRRDTIVYALLIQAAILAITVFVVVIAPGSREEPEFTSRPTIYLPQRQLEHQVALADFQQATARPMQLERLVTSAMLPPDLPSLPTVPRTDFDPLSSADLLTRDAQALLAQSGLAGTVTGLKTKASTAAFFGIEDSGERIVIVVNTSVSVRNKAKRRGVTWAHIQKEVTDLIDRLDAGTLFAIVQFSQGVRTFPDFLAPATESNRKAAADWVGRELRGNPPIEPDEVYFGHEAAFEAAFRLEPDVVFLVTDGVLDRREVTNGRVVYPEMDYNEFAQSLQQFASVSPREAHVHVIGFELKPRAAENMRKLVRQYHGQLREF